MQKKEKKTADTLPSESEDDIRDIGSLHPPSDQFEDADMPFSPLEDHLSDGGESILTELSEDLGDIPVFESENLLIRWLDAGKEKLSKIMSKLEPTNTKGRGQYYRTQPGGQPAARTIRLKNQQDRDTRKQHGKGIMGWLQKPSPQVAESVNPAVCNRSVEVPGPSVIDNDTHAAPLGDNSGRKVAIEEILDEEDLQRTILSLSEVSLLEEDGLGELPEVFLDSTWATAMFPVISPSPPHHPQHRQHPLPRRSVYRCRPARFPGLTQTQHFCTSPSRRGGSSRFHPLSRSTTV
ncbi:hypothetical protein B0H10DRAFT_1943319 [Mycena sp. CBHHK59/15]|nr:hypothetical protein B0H10DRAFT_1943319 [Mycena sp. CBHHK59/15]